MKFVPKIPIWFLRIPSHNTNQYCGCLLSDKDKVCMHKRWSFTRTIFLVNAVLKVSTCGFPKPETNSLEINWIMFKQRRLFCELHINKQSRLPSWNISKICSKRQFRTSCVFVIFCFVMSLLTILKRFQVLSWRSPERTAS